MSRVLAVLASSAVVLLSAGTARRSLDPRPGVPGGVEVTPKGDSLAYPTAQTGVVVPFAVKNTKTTAATYTLTCTGTGSVTCTDYEPHSVSLAPQEAVTVFATFNLGTTSGTLTLSASGPASDAGWYVVTITPPPSPIIALRNFNRDNRDRGLCLTAGAGEAAAWQCGDLLVSHGMPGYATLGRDRAITLVYSSAQAAPRGVVPVAVTQGSVMMTSVTADFSIDKGAGFVPSNATGIWNPWKQSTRQIVLSANADTLPTGAYKISTSVVDNYAGIFTSATAPDTLLIVNRRKSRFGKGWSVAGIEELVFNQPVNTALGWILWVGGEGSAKLYRKLTATTWVAPAGAFRDTLVYDGTAKTYTRTLRHGIKVVFDSLGRHQQTINRTGHATQFFWSGSPARLDSIKVPPAGRPRTTYTFAYTAAGLIDSITDPAGRALKLTVAADSTITAARDPLVSLVTTFQYDAQGRMTRRTSPRGFSTRYEYANGLRLTRISEPYGSNTPLDTARTQFAPWDEGGISLGATTQTAVDTALAFTVIRGPRYPAVADTASFYVDRWGAPTKTVNALGHTSTYARSDAASPALITRVVFPNGRVAKLSWNGRANLLSQTDSTDRGQATSTWEYNDVNTADSPSRTLDPLGRATRFGYDSLGLTDSVIDPRGHITRFWKRASGGKFNTFIKGTLDSVVERNVNTWWESDSSDHVQDQVVAFTYDTLGNVRTQKSPIGVITTMVRDSATRVTDVYDPFGKRQQLVYDAVNRITESRQYTTAQAIPFGITPLATCDATQVLCSDISDTAGGLPAMLVTKSRQAPAGTDSVADPRGVTRKFGFEARGAAWKETDEAGFSRLTFFNAAGLVDSTRSRDSLTIRYQYDVLGRKTRMDFPARAYPGPNAWDTVVVRADSGVYTYNVAGNLLTATNRWSTIRREYYLDGLLKKQVTAGPVAADSLEFTYNLAGQRTQLLHNRADTTDYRYKPSGDLDSIIVRWAGTGSNRRRVFTFQWDSLGRRRMVTYPGATTVTLSYDATGMLRRLVSAHPGGPVNGNDRLDLTFRNRRVDAVGRTWYQWQQCDFWNMADQAGQPCGGAFVKADSSRYTFLGMVASQWHSSGLVDTLRYDASGNITTKYNLDVLGAGDKLAFTMAAGSNRVSADSSMSVGGFRIAHVYDREGASLREVPPPPSSANAASYKWRYFDALGRLAGTMRGGWLGNVGFVTRPNTDWCRYDADGQLALACENLAPWLGFDGHNVYQTMLTTTNTGYTFVSGPGVDDPLMGRYRLGTQLRELYMVTDGAGRQLVVADSTGYATEADFGPDQGLHKYAGGIGNSNTFASSRFATTEVPGVAFFRNRQYDGRTGRWTQEDPIGLAGGGNLYQFNGNNPVAYTDPFGLWSISVQFCSHGVGGVCGQLTFGRENGQTLFRVRAGVGVGAGVQAVARDAVPGSGRPAPGGAVHVGFVANAGVGIAHAGADVTYNKGGTWSFDGNGRAAYESVSKVSGGANLNDQGKLSLQISAIAGVEIDVLKPQ